MVVSYAIHYEHNRYKHIYAELWPKVEPIALTFASKQPFKCLGCFNRLNAAFCIHLICRLHSMTSALQQHFHSLQCVVCKLYWCVIAIAIASCSLLSTCYSQHWPFKILPSNNGNTCRLNKQTAETTCCKWERKWNSRSTKLLTFPQQLYARALELLSLRLTRWWNADISHQTHPENAKFAIIYITSAIVLMNKTYSPKLRHHHRRHETAKLHNEPTWAELIIVCSSVGSQLVWDSLNYD